VASSTPAFLIFAFFLFHAAHLVTFVVEGDVATFQPDDFVQALSQQLAVSPKAIQVVSYSAGSVVVQTRLSQSAYDALAVVDDRMLAGVGVMSVTAEDPGFRVRSERMSVQTSLYTVYLVESRPFLFIFLSMTASIVNLPQQPHAHA
jgi:hypothetical protein